MRPAQIILALAISGTGLTLAVAVVAMNREYRSGIDWPEPKIVTPGAAGNPPSDAVVLFDGTNLSAWEPNSWIVKDGILVVANGDLKTKQVFEDFQLHVEWSSPENEHGHGQDRGNSGIFLQDRYEIQVLDSYQNETYRDGQAGAMYKEAPPLVNAMRPPGDWNMYDIIWTAPRFNSDGTLKSPAYVTALHNGVLIQNHFAVVGLTPWMDAPKYVPHGPGPIRLQDHGHPVRYRNIWIRTLEPTVGKRSREPYYHDHDSGQEWLVSESEQPPGN